MPNFRKIFTKVLLALAFLFLLVLGCIVNSLQAVGQNPDSLCLTILNNGKNKAGVDQVIKIADSIVLTYQHDPTELVANIINISKHHGYTAQLGKAYLIMGNIHRQLKLDFNKAEFYYDSAISITKETKDYTTYGRSLLGQAFVFSQKVSINGSRKQFYEAIKMLEKGDALGRDMANEQYIIQLEWDGEREKARKRWIELTERYEKRGQLLPQLFALDKAIFMKLSDHDTSNLVMLMDKMLAVTKKNNYYFPLAQAHFHLGRYYYDKGQYNKSLENLLVSNKAYKNVIGLNTYRSYVAVYIARCYEHLNNLKLAKLFYYEAYVIIRYDQTPSAKWVIGESARFFERLGKLDSALYYKNKELELVNKQLDERNLHVNELAELYNAREALIVNEKLKHDLKYQNLIVWSAVLVCTLLIVISIIIFQSRKKIKVKNIGLRESIIIRERLLSVLSHDIKGPLYNIHALIDLKKYGTTKEELDRLEQMISTNVKNTIDLLNNILSWASSQLSGKKDVTITKLKISDLVDDIYKTFKPLAEQKGLTLLVDSITDSFETIETDSSIVHLVLRNLVNNAIKFTKSGTITIRYIIESDLIHFEVVDTGIGLSEEKIKSIFSGQSIGKKSVGTNKESGSGLGLMICQQYLNKLGSDLRYRRASLTGGSIFYFSLSVKSEVPDKGSREIIDKNALIPMP